MSIKFGRWESGPRIRGISSFKRAIYAYEKTFCLWVMPDTERHFSQLRPPKVYRIVLSTLVGNPSDDIRDAINKATFWTSEQGIKRKATEFAKTKLRYLMDL